MKNAPNSKRTFRWHQCADRGFIDVSFTVHFRFVEVRSSYLSKGLLLGVRLAIILRFPLSLKNSDNDAKSMNVSFGFVSSTTVVSREIAHIGSLLEQNFSGS